MPSSMDKYVRNFVTAVAMFCRVPGATLVMWASSMTPWSAVRLSGRAFGKCLFAGDTAHGCVLGLWEADVYLDNVYDTPATLSL